MSDTKFDRTPMASRRVLAPGGRVRAVLSLAGRLRYVAVAWDYRGLLCHAAVVVVVMVVAALVGLDAPGPVPEVGREDAVPSCQAGGGQTGGGLESWDYAQGTTAPAIAQVVRDTDLTDEEIRTFQDEYGPALGDPFVANALMETVSARELYAFAERVGVPSPYSTAGRARADILYELGEVLVLSTGGVNLGSAAQAGFDQVRGDLRGAHGETMDELAAYRVAEYQEAGRKVFGQVRQTLGYSLFSQLTGAAAQRNPGLALGAGFYQEHDSGPSMAADIVTWDHDEEVGSEVFHADMADTELMVGSDRSVMDPLHSVYLLSDTPDPLCAAAGPAVGPVEERRLEALRGFLASDTGFSVDAVEMLRPFPMSTARYLTGHRVDGDFPGFQDGGEAFGDVLADASRPDPDTDADWRSPDPSAYAGGKDDPAYLEDRDAYDAKKADDKLRAEIAANFVVGYQDGLDWRRGSPQDDVEREVDGEPTWGRASSRLRSWAGTIISPHLSGMANSLGERYPINVHTLAIGGMRGHDAVIKFDPSSRYRLLNRGSIFEDLAFDAPAVTDPHDPDDPRDDEYEGGRPPAIKTLLASAQDGYTRDLAEASSAPAQRDQYLKHSLDNVGRKWAMLLTVLYAAPAEATRSVAQAVDEENAAQRSIIGEAYDLVPYSNLVDRKLADWLLDGGPSYLSRGLDRLLPTNNAEQAWPAVKEKRTEAARWMTEELYSAIADGGTLVDMNGRPIDLEALSRSFSKDSSFVDDDNHLIPWSSMTDEQKGTFMHYVSDNTGYYKVLRNLRQKISDAGEMLDQIRSGRY